jgi:hypothetical protein
MVKAKRGPKCHSIRFFLIRPTRSSRRLAPESAVSSGIDRVTRLAQQERFVFAMSVPARYSDRECSTLLNCRVQDIADARLLALRTIGASDAVEQSIALRRAQKRTRPCR